MEIIDLYDRHRNKLDQTIIRDAVQPVDTYYLIVHACIFNKHGQLLIQHRHSNKSRWSNLWDVSVGGAANAGDTSQNAIQRELQEELGIPYDFSKSRPLFTVNFERGFDDFYIIHHEITIADLNFRDDEVQDADWASQNQILDMINEGTFIQYEPVFIQMIFAMARNGGQMFQSMN